MPWTQLTDARSILATALPVVARTLSLQSANRNRWNNTLGVLSVSTRTPLPPGELKAVILPAERCEFHGVLGVDGGTRWSAANFKPCEAESRPAALGRAMSNCPLTMSTR